MTSDLLKKAETLTTVAQIINMPKYKVLGHETSKIDLEDDGTFGFELEPEKGTTNIMVIYLKE